MYRKSKLFFYCIIFMLILSGCSKTSSKVETTDLSNISVDSITIGSNIKSVDLTKYTDSDRYSGNYTYKFEEIVINTKDDMVDYLFARFDENDTTISINGSINLTNIDDVEDVLGNNFEDKWYDKEQGLRAYVYYDYENKIEAKFVYIDYNYYLTWIKLSKIK